MEEFMKETYEPIKIEKPKEWEKVFKYETY